MGSSMSLSSQNVLICGLEKSGKTLFLKKILELKKKKSEGNILESTYGYNYVTLEYGNQNYHVWDLGGDSVSRRYWSSFYRNIQVNIVIFLINLYDKEEKQMEAIKEFLYLVNEEELKHSKFFIILNMKIDDKEKKIIFTDNDMKEAMQTVDYLFSIIKECQVHDLDNRVSYFIADVSKIKQGELSTTKMLNKCFLIPEDVNDIN